MSDETDRPAPDSMAGESFGEVLLSFAGRLTRLQTEILAGLDVPLTIRQYRILTRVGAGHTSLMALCRLAHRNPPTMSESVNKLVKQGLLTRETKAADRRTMALALTPEGREAQEAGRLALEKFSAELTAGLDERIKDDLLTVMHRIYTETESRLDDR
ncbi:MULTISPECIES: MarR family winged helix-turn-helix transcriptional regulator [unclassified Amycolatopsis]|uniref:MarR family winged helix-turn-helix transcriptional regulator n=1 Tax=unclassified Amycolatopsis TaxID=2618356 RepID=UPI00026270C9|nr:MarR family winged helix-turn-helix transcriptional regulator [Amycolatopsis sp. ATCC 39116]